MTLAEIAGLAAAPIPPIFGFPNPPPAPPIFNGGFRPIPPTPPPIPPARFGDALRD